MLRVRHLSPNRFAAGAKSPNAEHACRPRARRRCLIALMFGRRRPSFWRSVLYRLDDAVRQFGWLLLPQSLRELRAQIRQLGASQLREQATHSHKHLVARSVLSPSFVGGTGVVAVSSR
jgi:hypothetical protein